MSIEFIRRGSRSQGSGMALLLLLICICSSLAVNAQVTTADVVGTVTDNSGVFIPAAQSVFCLRIGVKENLFVRKSRHQ